VVPPLVVRLAPAPLLAVSAGALAQRRRLLLPSALPLALPLARRRLLLPSALHLDHNCHYHHSGDRNGPAPPARS
jgi:hypothetical protein